MSNSVDQKDVADSIFKGLLEEVNEDRSNVDLPGGFERFYGHRDKEDAYRARETARKQLMGMSKYLFSNDKYPLAIWVNPYRKTWWTTRKDGSSGPMPQELWIYIREAMTDKYSGYKGN